MARRIIHILLTLLISTPLWSQTDWLIERPEIVSTVLQSEKEIIMANGLISRTIRIIPNAATVSMLNMISGEEYIRSVKAEALISINGISYPVGGLSGQKDHGYLKPEWLDDMEATENSFLFQNVTLLIWKNLSHGSRPGGLLLPNGKEAEKKWCSPTSIPTRSWQELAWKYTMKSMITSPCLGNGLKLKTWVQVASTSPTLPERLSPILNRIITWTSPTAGICPISTLKTTMHSEALPIWNHPIPSPGRPIRNIPPRLIGK